MSFAITVKIQPETGKGRRFTAVGEKVSIGRSADASISLQDPKLSRIHAWLSVLGDQILLTDHKSRNGTFLNGVKIESNKPVKIAIDQEFKLGDHKLQVTKVLPLESAISRTTLVHMDGEMSGDAQFVEQILETATSLQNAVPGKRPSKTAQLALNGILTMLRSQSGFIAIKNHHNWQVALSEPDSPKAFTAQFPLNAEIIDRMAARKQAMFFNPSEELLHSKESLEYWSGEHNSQLAVILPVVDRTGLIGVLYADVPQKSPAPVAALKRAHAVTYMAILMLRSGQVIEKLQEDNSALKQQSRDLEKVLKQEVGFGAMASRTALMGETLTLAAKVAETDIPVHLFGETGTGKELLAHTLHAEGPRAHCPFIAINCAALTESLLESELFGHKKGSFTGADKDRQGVIEQAHGGTLFLDEIGDISPSIQVRLLRFLQEGTVRPVGGDQDVHVDVRVLSATHRDLEEEVKEGRFREDLYFRLMVFKLEMPPLRNLTPDLPAIAQKILQRISEQPLLLSDEVIKIFERYPWPGNVRELENEIKRMSVLDPNSEVLQKEHISPHIVNFDLTTTPGSDPVFLREGLKATLEVYEKELVEVALKRCDFNKTKTAEFLGLSRRYFLKKLKNLGID